MNNLELTKESLQCFLAQDIKTDKSFKNLFTGTAQQELYSKTNFLLHPNRRPPYNNRARIEERVFCWVNNIFKVPRSPISNSEIFTLSRDIVLSDETVEDLTVSFPYNESEIIDMTVEHTLDKNYLEQKILSLIDSTLIPGKSRSVTLFYKKAVYMNWVKIYLNSKGINYKELSADEALFFIKRRLTERPKCHITGEYLRYIGSGEYNIYSSQAAAFSVNSNRSKNLSIIRKKVLKQSKDQILEKSKQTNLKKYGTEYGFLSNPVKEKIRKTMNERYGVDHPSYSIEIQQKKKNTFQERYNQQPCSFATEAKRVNAYEKTLQFKDITPLFTLDEFRGTGAGSLYKWERKSDKTTFFAPYYSSYEPISDLSKSGIEQFVVDYLKQNNIEYKFRDRNIIAPLELDFIIPQHKLAIEVNGIYYHSTQILKDKFYHYNKFNFCKQQNVRLIQLLEDEIRQKPQIIKNRLNHVFNLCKYRIYARKCEIKEITSELKGKFLEKYHLQGSCSSKINLGAFYKGRLVAVMTFSQNRISISQADNTWELTRFATIGNFFIIGIASKLFQYFIKNYNAEKLSIITYSDLNWGTGDLYVKLGFKFEKVTGPGYFYYKNGERFHRFILRKSELPKKMKNYDATIGTEQNLINNHYLKIFNSGNYKYNYTYETLQNV